MFEEIIFKQKIRYILTNKKNKRNSSLNNYKKKKSIFKSNDYNYSQKNKICNSLIQKITRNSNNFLNNSLLKSENNKNNNLKPIFNLTSPRKTNLKIERISDKLRYKKKSGIIDIYKKRSDLIIRSYFEEKEKVFPWKNPFKDYKEPLFIYQLLKFKKEKKCQNTIPIFQDTNYRTYVSQKNKININPININNKSTSLSHRNYVDNLINKVDQDDIIENIKQIRKEEKRKLYDIELKDTVVIRPKIFDETKNIIHNLLTNESDIKKILKDEIFYKKYENKINFKFDGLKLPVIKNNLVKIIFDKEKEWNNINSIEHKTFQYLNLLKIKIQRHKDNKKIIKNNKNKFKKEKKKEGIFIVDDNNNVEIDEEFLKEEIQEFDQEFLYDVSRYFFAKIMNYKNVKIANNLIKNCVFNKFNKIIEEK